MTSRLLSLFPVAICILALFLTSESRAQDPNSQFNKEHLIGVAESHFDRLASWDSGDVLVRVRVTGTGGIVKTDPNDDNIGPNSPTVIDERTMVMRLVFDFHKKRFLGVATNDNETRMFDSLDKELRGSGMPARTSSESVILIDNTNNTSIARINVGNFHKIKANVPIEEVFARYGFIQIKGIGIATWNGPWNDQDLKKKFNTFYNPDVVESVTHIGENRYRTLSRVPMPRSNVGGIRMAVDWDVLEGVPVAYNRYPGYDDDTTPAMESGRVKWKEINSQMLPIHLREKTRRSLRVPSGETFVLDDEIEIDLHWFSINKELPDILFDEAKLRESGRVTQLILEHTFEGHGDAAK